jgi:hypothetical protein
MSMPTTRPAGPIFAAATKQSKPPPEPTSTTRSPAASGRSAKGLAGERFHRFVRHRRDHRSVVAELGREDTAGVPCPSWPDSVDPDQRAITIKLVY